MSDALVMAGAVSKSAFGAGALRVLSDPAVKARLRVDITRIVAVSSGALNGAYFAAALQSGQEAGAGDRMAQLWIEDATIPKALSFSPRALLARQAIASTDNYVKWMRENIAPGATRRPIALRIVVTDADGAAVSVEGMATARHERVLSFSEKDFETSRAIERVFQAVAGSSAFPGLFAPVTLDVGGQDIRAYDGGLTDNTPLGHALANAPEIDRVFVIVPFPRVPSGKATLRGMSLVSQVFEILVQERLFRDLRNAERVNRVLGEFEKLIPDGATRAAVFASLGWTGRRRVRIVEISPHGELPGDAFAGFFSRTLRRQYVDAGARAAEEAIAGLAGPP